MKFAFKTWLGLKLFKFGGKMLLRGGLLAAVGAAAKGMMPKKDAAKKI